jgi:hypothetical protein
VVCFRSRSQRNGNVVSNRKQSAKKRAVSLQGHAQVFRRDLISRLPVPLQFPPFIGEDFRQALHGRSDKLIGFLDGLPWFIDKTRLNLVSFFPEMFCLSR